MIAVQVPPSRQAPPQAGGITGNYTLAVTANCPPENALAAALRMRQYSATVLQYSDHDVEVRLSGAKFDIEASSGKGDRVFGRIVPEGILFDLKRS